MDRLAAPRPQDRCAEDALGVRTRDDLDEPSVTPLRRIHRRTGADRVSLHHGPVNAPMLPGVGKWGQRPERIKTAGFLTAVELKGGLTTGPPAALCGFGRSGTRTSTPPPSDTLH